MGLFKPRSALQRTKADVLQDCMHTVLQQFPGAKLTLVVRTEEFKQPIIVTNDEQAEAIKAMREMMPGKPGFIASH